MTKDGALNGKQNSAPQVASRCDPGEAVSLDAARNEDQTPDVSPGADSTGVMRRPSCSLLVTRPRRSPGLTKQPAALVKLCERLRREIRERKKVQIELKKKELHFRRLVETMNSGLAIQDEQGTITYVNDKLLEISGYDRVEFIGRPIEHVLSMIRTANRREVLDELEKRRQGKSASYEIAGYRKDGARLSLLVSPRLLLDEQGQFRGSFAVLTDISELKEAEERMRVYREQLQSLSCQLLKTQEREKKRLSLELHDNLGQALVALKLVAKSIRMRMAPDQEGDLSGECTWLVKLADEIVQKFRDLCGDLSPLIIEDVGLAAAMRMLMEDFASSHGTVCEADVDNLDHVLDAEAQILIYRILQECLDNVAQHAAASRVALAFKRDSERATFRIEDNGAGFAEDYQQPGHPSGKTLGLITMAERVRVLGGNLDVKSVKGCTLISFSIPLQA